MPVVRELGKFQATGIRLPSSAIVGPLKLGTSFKAGNLYGHMDRVAPRDIGHKHGVLNDDSVKPLRQGISFTMSEYQLFRGIGPTLCSFYPANCEDKDADFHENCWLGGPKYVFIDQVDETRTYRVQKCHEAQNKEPVPIMGHESDLVLSHAELCQFIKLGGFQKLSDMLDQQKGFQFLKAGTCEPLEVIKQAVVEILKSGGGLLITTNYDDTVAWMEAVDTELRRRITPASVFDYIHTTQHGEKLRKVSFTAVREAICRLFTCEVKWQVANSLADLYREDGRQTLLLAGPSSQVSKPNRRPATYEDESDENEIIKTPPPLKRQKKVQRRLDLSSDEGED